MIDGDEIRQLILKRRGFRIGARGVCINCHPKIATSGWEICIPRAFASIDAIDIDVLDDADYFHLCYCPDDRNVYYSLADLTKYSKVTVMY